MKPAVSLQHGGWGWGGESPVCPRHSFKSRISFGCHLFPMNKSVNPIWIQEQCLPDFCIPVTKKRCKRYGGVVTSGGFCLLRAEKNLITVNKQRFYGKLMHCVCSVECFGVVFNGWSGLPYIILVQMFISVGVRPWQNYPPIHKNRGWMGPRRGNDEWCEAATYVLNRHVGHGYTVCLSASGRTLRPPVILIN